ncbi:MAG TPA: caspase family protein, partial [Pyrinomonadaceae bacterium]|nr:caspase family protein [Pyrinomonadaceae bacterium]
MAKKALCIGVNDYPYGAANDLRGCVNDCNDWAALLRDHYDFTDIQVVQDGNARKAAIMDGIKNLLADARSGDVLVLTNASHGTYEASASDDEDFDEALCPYDTDSNLIVDDELRELFANVPAGVNLTVISDSCHSGSVTRVVLDQYRRRRFLPPDVRGSRVLTAEQMRAARKKKRQQGQAMYPESGMNEILLSGCRDVQTSADAYIAGDYHGAMSYYAIQAIREADYRLTYAELHKRLCELLEEAVFETVPQLQGKDEKK